MAISSPLVATAAHHDRCANLIKSSGLTIDQAHAVVDSDTFGALTAELGRAEANHHNVDTLVSRLIKARGFTDAEGISSVIHHCLANATTRTVGSRCARYALRLIARPIPEVIGHRSADMQQALAE